MNECVEVLNRWGENFSAYAWPMLWQSSLLIAVIFVFDLIFARRVRASVRYALWMVVLVKLLLPPALALPTGATWWLWRPRAVVAPAPANQNYTVSFSDSRPEALPPPASVPVVVPPPKLTGEAWLLLALAAMGAGLLSWLAFRWLSVAAKVRHAAAAPSEFDGILEEARQLAGLRRRLRLKLIDDRQSPALYGLFRPVILLPRTLAGQLAGRQLRAVLLHEAMHLRRGDVWVNFAQTLLQIAYWWHPLLWLANARIRRVREEAVDDAVMVALRDGADAYAPTLLEVAKFAFRRPFASLGLIGILESRSALRQRVERLVNYRAPRTAGVTFLSLFGIFAFSTVALPMGQGPASGEQTVSPGLNQQNSSSFSTNGSQANAFSQEAGLELTQALALRHTDLPLPGPGPESAHSYVVLTSHANVHPGRTLRWADVLKLTRLDQFGPFQHATLSVVIDKLSMKDSFIPILTTSKLLSGSQTVIDLPKMTNAALSDILDAIVQGANPPIKYSLLDRYIVFFPFPQPDNLNDELFDPISGTKVFVSPDAVYNPTASDVEPVTVVREYATNIVFTSANREAIFRKLNSIHLDASYPSLPLNEVIRQLTELTRQLDRNKEGINFTFNPNVENPSSSAKPQINPNTGLPIKADASPPVADPTQINISLNLKNVSLKDLLNAICSGSDQPIKYSVEDYGIVFSPKGTKAPQYEKRTFKINSTFVSKLKSAAGYSGPGDDARDVSRMAEEFFSQLGVILDPPKTVIYDHSQEVLVVYATPQDLDLIEKAIQVLSVEPPIIHIKARFIEVPQKFFSSAAAMSLPWSITNGVGILTTTESKKVLQLLRSQKGEEELAEPEVITFSRRQAMIRATDFQPVVTNYTLLAHDPYVQPDVRSFETGPILDVAPVALSDGYTLRLSVTASVIAFLGYADPKDLTGPVVKTPAGDIVGPIVLPAVQTSRASAKREIYDGQTVVLFPVPEQESLGRETDEKSQERVAQYIRKTRKKQGDKVLVVFVTATLVDATGKRVHSDQDVPFSQTDIPPQLPDSAIVGD